MRLTLTIRTDKPEAEIGVFKDKQKIGYKTWVAHRQLAETIHKKIQELLEGSEVKLTDLSGIVVYEGPGSFTGLRIGISVANALAYSMGVPVVGSTGNYWIRDGLEAIDKGEDSKAITPTYGAPANTNRPNK